MKKCILSLFALVYVLAITANPVFSQYDSIDKNLTQFQVDERIKAMLNIADENLYKNIQISLTYAKKAYELSKKNEIKPDQMRAGKILGRIYTQLYDLNTALNYLNEAVSLGNYVSINNDYAKMLINIGEIYFKLNDFNASLEYFLKAQNESIDQDDIATIENSIGKIYFATGNPEKSLEYFNKVLNLYEKLNDKSIASESDRSIAMVYESQGNINEALVYYFKALMINQIIDRQDLISKVLNDLGKAYLKLKDYKNAEKFSLQAVETAVMSDNKTSLSRGYENLMNIYSGMKKYELAYKYSRLYTNIKDTVFSDAISDKIANEEVRLEIERKDKGLAVLSKENDLINFERYSIYVFALLVIAFAVYIFISYKKIRRINHTLEFVNKNLSEKNAKLEKSEKELLKINDEKNRLFSIISHDLRGPYSGYLGLLSILIENIDGLSKKDISELCIDLYSSIEGQYVMLENMLDWAKIQMGKMEFINEKFNVGERVNSIIEPYIPLFKYKSITCRINNTDKKKILNMDINTFDSVIRNLITNSIKFTNQNGRILIDIADSSDGMLIIKISDSGVGMTSEKIEEVLAGSKNISSFGTDGEKGSGIGMYLVKELIEKNNGKLKISSIQNIGTTVEVLLPCNQNN